MLTFALSVLTYIALAEHHSPQTVTMKACS